MYLKLVTEQLVYDAYVIKESVDKAVDAAQPKSGLKMKLKKLVGADLFSTIAAVIERAAEKKKNLTGELSEEEKKLWEKLKRASAKDASKSEKLFAWLVGLVGCEAVHALSPYIVQAFKGAQDGEYVIKYDKKEKIAKVYKVMGEKEEETNMAVPDIPEKVIRKAQPIKVVVKDKTVAQIEPKCRMISKVVSGIVKLANKFVKVAKKKSFIGAVLAAVGSFVAYYIARAANLQFRPTHMTFWKSLIRRVMELPLVPRVFALIAMALGAIGFILMGFDFGKWVFNKVKSLIKKDK